VSKGEEEDGEEGVGGKWGGGGTRMVVGGKRGRQSERLMGKRQAKGRAQAAGGRVSAKTLIFQFLCNPSPISPGCPPSSIAQPQTSQSTAIGV